MVYSDRNKQREAMQANRSRNKAIVAAYLNNASCASCGFDDPRTLEFDHSDPSTKEAAISDLLNGTASVARLEREIAKCTVLCCRCHRIKTIENRDWEHKGNKQVLDTPRNPLTVVRKRDAG